MDIALCATFFMTEQNNINKGKGPYWDASACIYCLCVGRASVGEADSLLSTHMTLDACL